MKYSDLRHGMRITATGEIPGTVRGEIFQVVRNSRFEGYFYAVSGDNRVELTWVPSASGRLNGDMFGFDIGAGASLPVSGCEPPDEFKGERYHWLKSERATGYSMAEWIKGVWYAVNEAGSISPFNMHHRGWEWDSVALTPEGAAELTEALQNAQAAPESEASGILKERELDRLVTDAIRSALDRTRDQLEIAQAALEQAHRLAEKQSVRISELEAQLRPAQHYSARFEIEFRTPGRVSERYALVPSESNGSRLVYTQILP